MPMEVRTRKADVTVNVAGPIPNGIFRGADTFSVGSQTKVLGNTNFATGDVAGGLIAPNRESASAVGSTPLQLLLDHAPASSSCSTAATAEQMKRAERRALEMLRQEKSKFEQHRADRK